MNRIKMLRKEKGLLQEDIGKFLGISGRAVGNYETEKRGIDTETASKLADFFGVSIDYLLGKTDIRKPDNSSSDIDMAFYDGYKGLNDTNKEIAKKIIEGLKANQNTDNKKE